MKSKKRLYDRIEGLPIQSTIINSFNYNGVWLSIELKVLMKGMDIRENKQSFEHPTPQFSRLFCFKKGGAILISNDKKWELKQGIIYLLPVNMPFSIIYKPSTLVYFHFRLSDFSSSLILNHFNQLQVLNKPELFKMIVDSKEKDDIELDSILMTTLLKFCSSLLDPMAEKKKMTARFGPIFEIIHNSKVASLRIEQLAKVIHTTKEALSKDFSRRMGISLKKYLNQIDQQRAIEFLLYSSLTIQEISDRLGYNNVNYFHKVFKTRNHLSPMEFRKNGLKRFENLDI